MITILIGFVIASIILFRTMSLKGIYTAFRKDWIGTAMAGVAGIFVTLVIALLPTLFISLAADYELVYAYEVEIVSLDTLSETEGSFVLGTGYIGSSQHYFYYKKTALDTYKRGQVSVYDAEIRESDEDTPCIEVYSHQLAGNWRYFCFRGGNHGAKYTLVVPRGTIIREFKVN